MRTIVWFRGKDLRVADHGPLADAAERGEVIPLFVLDPYFFAPERARAIPHRMQFLLESLEALAKNIAHLGSRLIVVAGKSTDVVPRLAEQWRADRVALQGWVEPFARERDRRVQDKMRIPLELFEGETLHPLGSLRTGAGAPYSVFTPFLRAFRAGVTVERPAPAPRALPPLPAISAVEVAIPSLTDLGITHNPRLPRGGERSARERLARFLEGPAPEYATLRDRMDVEGTSRLSQDLKFGTISPRAVYTAVRSTFNESKDAVKYLDELVWREFAHATLWDRPELLQRPFRPQWEGFPWDDDEASWAAWTAGTTGYPVVDASARQLLGEGYVHNRARMISASFLTKDLLIDFRKGEAHYLRWLVDGDWAQNDLGWQWATGCGCDAQPYFRIFNPVSQGERFDPSGDYVRRWVPELGKMPAKWIHRPWEAPSAVLRDAGVELGRSYPLPIVDHAEARKRFLMIAESHLGRGARS